MGEDAQRKGCENQKGGEPVEGLGDTAIGSVGIGEGHCMLLNLRVALTLVAPTSPAKAKRPRFPCSKAQ